MSKLISLRNLSYHYLDGNRKRTIFNQIDLEFEEGKFYTIVGESGSGKTTLLSLLAGLDIPKEGSIYFKGQDIKSIGYTKYRRNCISIVFQNFQLIPYLSAMDNVLYAMDISDNIKHPTEEVALSALKLVGIGESKAKRKVRQLSGGEQQRCAIARAIAVNTELIFADEPTGNLDHETSTYLVSIFQQLVKDHGKTIIMVTHNLEIAKQSDHCFKINQKTKKVDDVDEG